MAKPSFRLRRDVAVSPDPSRDDYQPGQLRTLEAGTLIGDIAASELDQLAPAHFFDEGGSDEVPEDWRTNPDTLAHDRRQKRNLAAERKARDKEREARRAEKAKAQEED